MQDVQTSNRIGYTHALQVVEGVACQVFSLLRGKVYGRYVRVGFNHLAISLTNTVFEDLYDLTIVGHQAIYLYLDISGLRVDGGQSMPYAR